MDKISELTQNEFTFQRDTLNLIASENYPSPKTLSLLSSVWDTKYAEGYGDRRYYAGNAYTAELDREVTRLALAVFSAKGYGVNLQVLSGSLANAMTYLSVLEKGDTVLSPVLSSGGHLSHFHEASTWLKFFDHQSYGVRETSNGFELDINDFKNQIAQHKPKLVIIGFSAYPATYDFDPLVKIAHDGGALVLADISHIAGLVATGLHSSPFEAGADFVSTTTHKTLRGPRGALLFAREHNMDALNRTIFPGLLGGPHLHQIAAIGQSLSEVVGETQYPDGRAFTDYIKQVVQNTEALEAGLIEGGVDIVTPSQTHLTLVRLPEKSDSLDVQQKLESLGIITNRNMIPKDTKTAWRPSGLRLGTAALTSRGMGPQHFRALGLLVAQIVSHDIDDTVAKEQVEALHDSLVWYYPKP